MVRVILALVLLFALPAQAKVVGETVLYTVAGETFKGYIARNTALTSPRPAVLVVHEWWGQNAYARQRANMLAGQGYVAMALDMYGAGKLAKHPDDAKAFMMATLQAEDAVKERFNAARELLAERPYVDATRTAAIGYCFGGGVVINLARAGTELAGVVSFHGALGPIQSSAPGSISTPLLVLNGDADPFTPPDLVQQFKQEMEWAEADLTFIGYPGVLHSFTNPGATAVGKEFGMPLAYERAADEDSWSHALAFLRRVLQ